MKIRDMSLKIKLGAIFIIALLLNLIGYTTMLQFIEDHRNDNYMIHLANNQHLLSQQIVNEMQVFINSDNQYEGVLQETVESFQDNQNDLTRISKETVFLTSNDKAITQQYYVILEYSKHFSRRISELLKNDNYDQIQSEFSEILKDYETGRNEMDRFTQLLEESSIQKVNSINYIQITIIFVNIAVSIFALWASMNHIILPITKLASQMKKVAVGIIDEKKIRITRKDEVGILADSYNSMVTNLQHLLQTGRAQSKFLPSECTNDSFEMKTIYKPSEYVSGDFFHYVWEEEKYLLTGYIIDVMGHGLATALHTSQLHVLFDQARKKDELSLVEKVQWINNESLQYLTDDTFAAGIYFQFDFRENTLKIVSCGIHYFIAIRKHEKTFETVEGTLLGLMENMQFKEKEIRVESGDHLYFFSDGLSDCLKDEDLKKFDSFIDGYDAITKVSNSECINDDVSALCIHIK